MNNPRAQQIRRAADRLGTNLDAVAQSMAERILAEVPVYRRLPPDVLSDVEELCVQNSQVLTEALRSGGRLDRDDLRYVAEHVRERVRSGVSLESMLHAYRVALTVFWEQSIAQSVALGFSRDLALELARRTSELSDDLTTHAAESYVREEARLRAMSDQAARDLLELLLRGEIKSETLDTHSTAPGLDSTDFLVVAGRVLKTEKPEGDALATASLAISGAFSTGRAAPLIANRNGAIVAVVPIAEEHTATERLAEVHRSLRRKGIEFVVGLSTRRSTLTGVPAAFDQATLAVSRASSELPIVSLSELPVVQNLMLGATSTMRGLLSDIAEEIQLDGPDDLVAMLTTLQAFADADMNLALAARNLHVHANTLRYRLARINERTGRDPHRLTELVDLICLLGLLHERKSEHWSRTG